MRRKLAAGNWKMNGTQVSLAELAALQGMSQGSVRDADLPPATLIYAAAGLKTGIAIGAQDCHGAENGAHTGDLSAPMLADAGATYVIIGHSERRAGSWRKRRRCRRQDRSRLGRRSKVILCIGESLEQRDDGSTLDVLGGTAQELRTRWQHRHQSRDRL